MIKPLLEKGIGSYFMCINQQNFYFCGFNLREKQDKLIEISPRDIVIKLDEVIAELNEITAVK